MAQTVKKIINNIAGVGIIYRTQNPSDIFLEIKADSYPLIAYRNHLCLIGGNWAGKTAGNDSNPIETFLREFREEISFDKAEEDTEERFSLFGIMERKHVIRNLIPTKEDRQMLKHLVCQVARNAKPYRDYLHIMPQEVIRRTDPLYARGDSKSILSINLVPVDEKTWQILTFLQEKFENLSNESQSCVLSLDLIIQKKLKCMAGYDRVLQQFWNECGFLQASEVPLDFEGVVMEELGIPLDYRNYLEHYEITVKPAHNVVSAM
jgi:8-oxo-dGTP pyrophosphatase MutT (NUDIX family)